MTMERFTVEIIEEELYPMPIYYDEGEKLQYYDVMVLLNKLHEENKQLKSDLARVIEQASKNDKFLRSDIRTLENALWCPNCANDIKRLKELRKEFLK